MSGFLLLLKVWVRVQAPLKLVIHHSLVCESFISFEFSHLSTLNPQFYNIFCMPAYLKGPAQEENNKSY